MRKLCPSTCPDVHPYPQATHRLSQARERHDLGQLGRQLVEQRDRREQLQVGGGGQVWGWGCMSVYRRVSVLVSGCVGMWAWA